MVTVNPVRLPVKLIVRFGSTAVTVLLVTDNAAVVMVMLGDVVPVGAGVTITALVLV